MSSIMLTQKAVMMPARSSMARATTARRARTVLVRAEEPGKPINTPSEVPAAPEATPMPTPAAPAPPAAPKAVTLSDAMAFNGAPELINGRLAMLGFVAALFAEISSQETVGQQFTEAAVPIVLTAVVFAAASLVPMLKGAKREAFGPLTPDVEIFNGRAAMIGFAALLAVELSKGSALF